jgi:hypothetical protein
VGGCERRTSRLCHGRLVAEGGFAVAAIDAPNRGDRPKDEEFVWVATENRARMRAGEAAAALVATCTIN